MGERCWRWTDAHFCSLQSQTNVYGLTKITDNNANSKLLVASLDGKFISIEYQTLGDRLTPCTKEVQFTYIPGDAEIVSVDVLRRCKGVYTGLIVGITFIRHQPEEEKESLPSLSFLNLYSASDNGDEENLDIIARGCKIFELDFSPYLLTHTQLVEGSLKEMVFLLSGDDKAIHLYREVTQSHGFQEHPVEDFFIELKDIPSSVLRLSIDYLDNFGRRLTVLGHQDGLLQVFQVNVAKNEVLQHFSTEHDSPVTSMEVFTSNYHVPYPPFLELFTEDGTQEETIEKVPSYNLLVTTALEAAVMYRNILTNGIEDGIPLPGSEKFDCALCTCVVDIDFDGQYELLIGTYGHQLLAYKYIDSIPAGEEDRSDDLNKQRHRSDETNMPVSSQQPPPRKVKSQEDISSMLKDMSLDSDTPMSLSSEAAGFKLMWQRSFPGPVVRLDRLDIMRDGMDDLVVVTLKGLHILQPNLVEVAEVCRERLRTLCEYGSDADDSYLNLQTEILETMTL